MSWTPAIRSGAAALVLASALGTGGCLQTDSKTTLKADGSGEVAETASFDIEKIKGLMEAAKVLQGAAGPGGAQAPEMDVDKMLEDGFGEAALKDRLKEIPGVEAKTVKSEVADGQRVVTLDYTFKDFASLAKTGYGFSGVELKKNDDGSWTLDVDATNGLGAFLGGGMGALPGGAPQGMPAGLDMGAVMAMFEPYVGTLEKKRTVSVPGTILETNGVKSEDGKSVSWTFGFKDMGTPSKDGKPVGRQFVTFKGEGLALKPFQYKPDVMAALRKATKPDAKPAEKPAGETPSPAKPSDGK